VVRESNACWEATRVVRVALHVKSPIRIFSLKVLCVLSAGLVVARGGSDDGDSSTGGSSMEGWGVDLNGDGGTGGGSGATVVDTGDFPDNIIRPSS
jgi:hypothetical protein